METDISNAPLVPEVLVRSRSGAADSPLRGYLVVLAGAAAFSTSGILIKLLLPYFRPEAIAFWRILLVTLTLGSFLARRPGLFRVRARHLPLFALYGAIAISLHQLLWIQSVQLNGAAVATVLAYISPVIVSLVSWRFLHEPLTRVKLLALALSTTGIVLLSQVYHLESLSLNTWGVMIGVGTAMTWAFYVTLGREASFHYSPWTTLFYAFLFGTLFLLPLQVSVTSPYVSNQAIQVFPLNLSFSGILPQGDRVLTWVLLGALALIPTLGGFSLYSAGLARLPASVVALIGTAEPVFSICLAFLIFGEVLSGVQGLGAALIMSGALLLRPSR